MAVAETNEVAARLAMVPKKDLRNDNLPDGRTPMIWTTGMVIPMRNNPNGRIPMSTDPFQQKEFLTGKETGVPRAKGPWRSKMLT